MRLFDSLWAEVWARELNESAVYQRAAANWRSVVVLRITDADADADVTEPCGIWADLHEGSCRVARAVEPTDLVSAPFVIAASRKTWQDLLSGRADAVFALMTGKLRLERGSMSQLMPYASAAKEMVEAARRVGIPV